MTYSSAEYSNIVNKYKSGEYPYPVAIYLIVNNYNEQALLPGLPEFYRVIWAINDVVKESKKKKK